MFGKNLSKRAQFSIMVAFATLILIVTGVTAAADCQRINGDFTLQTITGPTCTSSVDLCATGVYRGVLRGNSTFIGTSLTSTADTPTTSVIFVTGDNTIETPNGTLLTKDAIVLRTTGVGEFAEVDVVIGGTGEWAGATGTITATGTFSGGSGEGRFTGEICKP